MPHIRPTRFLYVIGDCASVLIAWGIAHGAHAISKAPPVPLLFWQAPAALCASFLFAFSIGKIYSVLWTHSFVKDTYRLIWACATGSILFFIIIIAAGFPIPFSLALLAALLFSICAVFFRMLMRDIAPRMEKERKSGFFTIGELPRERRILIVGAGEAGRLVLSEYHRKGIDRHIVGFVDDDPSKVGMIINGKKVFAKTERIPKLIETETINEIILAFPSAPKNDIVRVVQLARKHSPAIPIKILPPHTRLFENPISPDIREVGLTDILDREETHLDTTSIGALLAGKKILVTGAGGSIGSEICTQLLKFPIASLVAVGKGEHSIYQLARALFEYQDYLAEKRDIAFRIADVRDRHMMGKIMREFSPEIIFHAAAHKHVPLMEFNEAEAVLNNIAGTRNLLEAALSHRAERFVLISTDKAVRPTSVMGATKRAAEIIAQEYARKGLNASIVRFGNVIGSRGSVIPLFREQIERGGPVTVTHPQITRFFMSIPEAALLVLNAAAYARGGEIFVLNMGKQYRVMEIAESLIRLYGLEPHRDIAITITGLRPGEKMYEELSYEGTLSPTANHKIFTLAHDGAPQCSAAIETFLSEMEHIYTKTPLEIRGMLQRFVPEYRIEEENAQRSDRLVT